jgi:rRNA-processing protein FCF1
MIPKRGTGFRASSCAVLPNWITAAQVMEEAKQQAIRIFVDADACPVKPEIYRVAERYGLKVYVVANAFMNAPRSDMIERVIVAEGPDIADDWIVERATDSDIVVTADIPLANRCVKKGATVITPTGKLFTEPPGYFAVFVGARSGGDAPEAEDRRKHVALNRHGRDKAGHDVGERLQRNF